MTVLPHMLIFMSPGHSVAPRFFLLFLSSSLSVPKTCEKMPEEFSIWILTQGIHEFLAVCLPPYPTNSLWPTANLRENMKDCLFPFLMETDAVVKKKMLLLQRIRHSGKIMLACFLSCFYTPVLINLFSFFLHVLAFCCCFVF